MAVFERIDQTAGWERNSQYHCAPQYDMMLGEGEHHVLRHEWGSGVTYIPVKGNVIAVNPTPNMLIPQAYLHCIHCREVRIMGTEEIQLRPEGESETADASDGTGPRLVKP